tara:strand:- start:6496 stop:7959 length:1464 start_codon:yes stop_codon:yes gene_type:complete
MHSLLSLLVGFSFNQGLAAIVILVADLLALASLPSVLLRRRGRPMAALSWVLTLVALPYLGLLLWWTFGRTHLSRHRRKKRRANQAICIECPRPDASDKLLHTGSLLPFRDGNRRWTEGVFPPSEVFGMSVLCDGDEGFPAMEQAIASANTEIRALFYIWQNDEIGLRFAELLAQKARAGVSVRLLLDAVGSSSFIRQQGKMLKRAGVEVGVFLPARFRPWAPTFNFRNHRKLLLVDGAVGFIGGMNIGDEYVSEWHDLACRLHGPVLENLDDVFREDWFFATGADLGAVERQAKATKRGEESSASGACTVIASGPDRDENRVHDAVFLGITSAQERVWIATPYFVPSHEIMAALRGAAHRGLDVRLVIPKANDLTIIKWAARTYYQQLLDSGVRIFEYMPRFSHMKAMVLDRKLTLLGSPNVDLRSYRLNFELACMVESQELNEQVAAVLARDVSASEELTKDVLRQESLKRQFVESAAHLLSPLL